MPDGVTQTSVELVRFFEVQGLQKDQSSEKTAAQRFVARHHMRPGRLQTRRIELLDRHADLVHIEP